jgi:DNA mismatch repair protein MSH5
MASVQSKPERSLTNRLPSSFLPSTEVFHPDFLADTLPFTPAHMQVLLGRDASRLGEEITFLYKLRYGLELTSHATQCEVLCGIPHHLVERAAYIAQLSREHNLNELQLRIQDALQEEASPASEDLSKETMQRFENIAREIVQWDIETDEAAAAKYGEGPALDPRPHLIDILADL